MNGASRGNVTGSASADRMSEDDDAFGGPTQRIANESERSICMIVDRPLVRRRGCTQPVGRILKADNVGVQSPTEFSERVMHRADVAAVAMRENNQVLASLRRMMRRIEHAWNR